MKEFWRILKLIFAWIIGSTGVIIGLMVIFESDTWIQRIFTGGYYGSICAIDFGLYLPHFTVL